ncbi:MAG: sulfatase [Myxococcota bacterium]|jgi:arylsulfatase A-like enzyme|nr:sulfatase [Myxococcota bacterium]
MSEQSTRGRGSKRLLLGLLAAFIGVAAYWLVIGNQSPDDRPLGELADIESLASRDDLNVLFVVIDTLRSDRLSAYGYQRNTSPALDYLAMTGLRFDEHRAQSSWTKSSMASLWTGLYPIRTDVLRHTDALPEAAQLPAEILQDAGFLTAGLWRNGWVAPNFGFSQGFEIYQSPVGLQAPASMRSEAKAGRIDGTDIDLVFTAKEFLRSNLEERWFLYLHFMDVHQYISTEETAIFGATYSDIYDNSILWTDSQFGEVLMELYRLGLGKKTLIVVVSDHGEAFGEHGTEGHARDLYAEAVRTPFIISLPFRLPQAGVVRSRTENVDVWPTVLDMLGVSGLEEPDGGSQVPLLLGRPIESTADLGFAQLDRNWGQLETEESPLLAVRKGNLRLIHDVKNPERDRLYNVALDPDEQRDISKERTAEVEELLLEVERHLEQEAIWQGGSDSVEIDEMQMRQLRALGYSIE